MSRNCTNLSNWPRLCRVQYGLSRKIHSFLPLREPHLNTISHELFPAHSLRDTLFRTDISMKLSAIVLVTGCLLLLLVLVIRAGQPSPVEYPPLSLAEEDNIDDSLRVDSFTIARAF